MAKAFSRILFIVYSVVMIWLLFGQRFNISLPNDYFSEIKSNINLIPFRTIYEYAVISNKNSDSELLRHAFINLAGNVIMFIPLGFFLSDIWHNLRSFLKHTLCTAAIILIIETVQLFTLLGSFDIDDLILNVIGSVIGYGIWRIYANIFKKQL